MTAEYISSSTPPRGNDKSDRPHEAAGKLVQMGVKEGSESLVRDINVKIADIENQLMLMSLDVGGAHKELRETVDLLSQTQQALGENLAEVSAEVRIRGRQQRQFVAVLEERFTQVFQQLGESLNNANEAIDSQRERIDLLDSGHAELGQMHADLAQRVAHQSQQLARVEELAKDGISSNRMEIVALNEKHRQQLETLRLLSDDQDATRTYTQKLNGYIAELETNLAAQARKEDKRAGLILGLLAAVAVVTMASITYLELNPSRIPAPVSAQIDGLEMSVTSLNSDVAAAQSVVASNRSDMLALAENLQAGLNSQAQKTEEEVQQLNSRFEDLQYRALGPGTLAEVTAKPVLPLQDNDWLASQDSQHYSIQLAGFFRQQQLVDYINLNAASLGEKTLFSTQVKYGTRDWYNLYTGSYGSLEEAEAALDTLPLRLRSNSPYVRSFGTIQRAATR
ncbi:hypothetical protein G8764_12125 [Pseudomaricurvus alcaniphilus]|uniref:SPOR domain-containing protein n=1 Tax=Pseudomaricurvus alcaniphilus TaxID=1166482 RepID=UPI001407C4C2|nr:SPOR domain-containing protein [Pseudomaricurvus alcaniphilus]NHN38047.1 hypothetical protein [Pseudomaricurvus alcaniphilus]